LAVTPRDGAKAVANYKRELDATPQEQKERRERLEWQIRRVQNRIAEVHARLTAAGG
jgi:phage shock protein A